MKAMTGYALLLALALLPLGALAEEARYTTHIRPLFEAKCRGCHGPDSPEYPEFVERKKQYAERSKGPKMDSYAHLLYFIGWPDTGALMRRLDDGKNSKEGKPGNMYQYLGANDEERQKNLMSFREWVGNWTLERWPEITKEEMNGIKVRY